MFSLTRALYIEEGFTLKCWASSFRYASGCSSTYCLSFWGSIFLLRGPCFFGFRLPVFCFRVFQLVYVLWEMLKVSQVCFMVCPFCL